MQACSVAADEPIVPHDKKPVSPWVSTGINLLAWPGIGTYMAGQKVTGTIQATLALVGGLLSLCLIAVLFRFAMKLVSTHFDSESFVQTNGMLLGLGAGGLGMLSIVWIWAAISSFQNHLKNKK